MSIDIFFKGGELMWVLLAFSFFSLAIIFAKSFQFFSLGLFRKVSIEEVFQFVQKNELKQAGKILEKKQDPLSRFFLEAVNTFETKKYIGEQLKNILFHKASVLLRSLESWLRPLSIIAAVSPLVGLLGTVTGMIRAFSTIEIATTVSPSLIAGGIWEALITTAFGLMISIVSLIAYYTFEASLEKLEHQLQRCVSLVSALE